MKKNTETIIDEKNVEVLVSYFFEETPSQIEECHGYHDVGNMVYTEITSVEIVIAGVGINILPQLSEKQLDKIMDMLTYE